MEAKPASDPSATSGRPCYDWGPYHDEVWGTPLRTSRELFAQLSLASQQAGLSWRVVWSKREGYAAAFRGWDFRAIASMTATDVDELCGPAWAGRVLQSRRKLEAIVHNAGVCVEIEDSYPGGLARMIRVQRRPHATLAAYGTMAVRFEGVGSQPCLEPRRASSGLCAAPSHRPWRVSSATTALPPGIPCSRTSIPTGRPIQSRVPPHVGRLASCGLSSRATPTRPTGTWTSPR